MTAIYWFRKALRLHDNPSLLALTSDNTVKHILPIFIVDDLYLSRSSVGVNRMRFLQECLADLDKSLQKLNSRLFVLRGSPVQTFEHICKLFSPVQVAWELDYEPYAKERDASVRSLLVERGAKTEHCGRANTLFDPEKEWPIPPFSTYATNPCRTTYGSFVSFFDRKKLLPTKPVSTAAKLAPPPRNTIELLKASSLSYSVPSKKEMIGLLPKSISEKSTASKDTRKLFGGETAAIESMKKYLADQLQTATFEKPKTHPFSVHASTTELSPYLKFGCLSVRTFWWELDQTVRNAKETDAKLVPSKPPVSLPGQLLWREFYIAAAATTPNFGAIEGNPICRQIKWDHTASFLDAWSRGLTGFPLVDASMRQLRQEGWIHHLARHLVACFLTRGHLWQSWEQGAAVFEELLLDADPSLNFGNWMWLSASAFFHQYWRIYSPVSFSAKHPDTEEYVRHFVPELASYPKAYLFEPWKAPKHVQEQCGCIIGTDYPKRIIDHDEARKVNMARFKQQLQQFGSSSSPSPKRQRKA